MSVVVAALLSLVFPGAGQAYNGQLGKGIGFGAIYLLLPIPLLFLMLHGQEWAMWTISGIKIVVPLVSFVDAAGRAYEIRAGKRSLVGGGWMPGLSVLAGGIVLRVAVALLTRPLAANILQTVGR